MFYSCLLLSEEILVKSYRINSSLLAGMEGFYALCFSIIGYPFLEWMGESIEVKLFFQ